MPIPYQVAVLTVSDTASLHGPTYDTSGPLLISLINAHPSYKVVNHGIVPDDGERIGKKVFEWAGEGGEGRVDWIITTGGTGLSPTDLTPQSLIPYLLPLPILQHALNDYFFKSTPRSVLSRPVVGLLDVGGWGRMGVDLGESEKMNGEEKQGRTGTLVLCLPGSRGACKDGWAAMTGGPLKGILEHGLSLLTGGAGCGQADISNGNPNSGTNDTGSEIVHPARMSVRVGNEDWDGGRGVDEASARGEVKVKEAQVEDDDGGCGCGRRHDDIVVAPEGGDGVLSVDPSKSVARRLRKSPFPMIPLSSALSLIHHHAHPLPSIIHPVDHTLRNHVLAEDVFAATDLPSSRTTNVDGYGVVAGETPVGEYEVVGSQVSMSKVEIGRGQVYRINTGGPLPPGTDAVIMVEDTELIESDENGGEKRIRILRQAKAGDEVRQPGSDAKKGEKVLEKGTVIGSAGGEIGLLGFVGQRQVSVHRRPIVAIMSTGNELVDLQSTTTTSSTSTPGAWSGIVDTNRPSLRAAIEGYGYDVLDLGIAKDNMEEHLKLFRKGLDEADVVITTGGTSMGESDLLKPMLEHELGGTIHFGRVAMKPGKPTTFASVPRTSSSLPALVFALPGNPASALVTFHLFCLPALRGLGGWPENRRQLGRVQVTLENDMPLDPREEFHRVVISPSKTQPGILLARTTGGQRSSRVASLCGANGFVHLPMRQVGGKTKLMKGEVAEALMIGAIHQ